MFHQLEISVEPVSFKDHSLVSSTDSFLFSSLLWVAVCLEVTVSHITGWLGVTGEVQEAH